MDKKWMEGCNRGPPKHEDVVKRILEALKGPIKLAVIKIPQKGWFS